LFITLKMGGCLECKSSKGPSSTLVARMQTSSSFDPNFLEQSSSSEVRLVAANEDSSDEKQSKLTRISILPLEQRGVTLEAIKKIIQDLKRNVINLNVNNASELLVEKLVKPESEACLVSYAETLFMDANTKHLVGDCNVYLSHPWSLPIADVVGALINFEDRLKENEAPKFYFVDWLCVNQHNPE